SDREDAAPRGRDGEGLSHQGRAGVPPRSRSPGSPSRLTAAMSFSCFHFRRSKRQPFFWFISGAAMSNLDGLPITQIRLIKRLSKKSASNRCLHVHTSRGGDAR